MILSRIVSPNSFKDQDDVDEITRKEKEKETSHMSTKVQAQSLPNISQNGYIENNNENSMDTLDPFQKYGDFLLFNLVVLSAMFVNVTQKNLHTNSPLRERSSH